MSNRRQPVAEGGMFSTPKANFSRETQELLKGKLLHAVYCLEVQAHTISPTVMMQESKLTNFQQRQLSQSLQSKISL